MTKHTQPEVNYCQLYGLPPPNWQYRTVPNAYGRERCAYCGDRASTVDAIPNTLGNRSNSAYRLTETWLVDSCPNCRTRAAGGSFRARRHSILVSLRLEYNTARGPLRGPQKLALERRIQVLSGQRKPWQF